MRAAENTLGWEEDGGYDLEVGLSGSLASGAEEELRSTLDIFSERQLMHVFIRC